MIYKNNKRVKQTLKNKSMLGCYNDRTEKLRKMAKVTALRLAETKKQDTATSMTNSGHNNNGRRVPGRNPVNSSNQTINSTKPISQSIYNGSMRNKQQNTPEIVKLPKVSSGSNKNIETGKKTTEPILRVNNSRDRARLIQ